MAWSASQYVKFEDERTRPARDLLAQVPLEAISRAVDLGCGPGNSTELIAERFGAVGVSGLDSDPDMLESARRRMPGTAFVQADLASWQPSEKADLLFSNAVFQWLPNHLDILERLMDGLAPGGVLAVQMPDNLDEPSHVAMRELADDPRFSKYYPNGGKRRSALPPPDVYLDRLDARCIRIDVWHTIYYHRLANAEAIVEWVKGTGLRPYLDALPADAREAYLAAYLRRIREAYPPLADGRVLLKFPRLFVVAVKR